MRSLSEINEKIGYRIAKVVIIFLAVASFLIYSGMLYDSYPIKKMNEDTSRVVCNYGDKGFFSLKQMNLSDYPYSDTEGFNYNDFYNISNDSNISKILNACYGYMGRYENGNNLPMMLTEQDIKDNIDTQINAGVSREKVQEFANLYTRDSNNEFILSSVYELASNSNHELFHIDKVFDYNTELVKYFIIGNIVIFIIYEILKRTLYYIASGTIRPKK